MGIEDFTPLSPSEGPPLPRMLGIKWGKGFSLTEAQRKELEKAKDHIGWALSKISELERSPSHTTLQQINEALYYSRDNLRTFSELMGWREAGQMFGPKE